MIGPDPGPAYILLELISGGSAPKSSTGVTPFYRPDRARRPASSLADPTTRRIQPATPIPLANNSLDRSPTFAATYVMLLAFMHKKSPPTTSLRAVSKPFEGFVN
jgi:hypothetical protein